MRRWLGLWLSLALVATGCRSATPSLAPSDPASSPKKFQQLTGNVDARPSPLDAVTAGKGGWYDPTPLLMALRPSTRKGLSKTAGLTHLHDLPYYDLSLRLDPDAGTFDLSEEIYFTNRESTPLGDVVLRIHANDLSQQTSNEAPPARVALDRVSCVKIKCTVHRESPSVVRLVPKAPIASGGRLRISVALHGVLERLDPKSTGLIAQGIASMMAVSGGDSGAHSGYGLLAVSDGFASMAGFYAAVGTRRNGKWERPDGSSLGDVGSDALSHVRLRVDVPSLSRVITSGVVAHERLVPARERRQFDIAAPMTRNLGVFAGSDRSTASRVVGEVTVHSHFRPEDSEPGNAVLETAAQALTVFEKRFGPYPFRDLDVIQAPLVGGAGGVEFSGLVAVATMLYRPFGSEGDVLSTFLGSSGSEDASPVSTLLDSMLEFTTAHEVAHQWWHAMVGSDSRRHPFVDESLAQYSTILYLEERYGRERAQAIANMQVKMNYHGMRLMGQPDGIVDRPVESFSSPLQYAGLVYGKGPYFYRELRKLVGDKAFFRGLRSYADQHRFKTAPARGPIDGFATGKFEGKVRALARRWLDETHGDEDLGRPSLKTMMSSMLGADADQLAPQAEMLMKLLGPTPRGKKGSGGGPSPAELKKMLEQMERFLDSK